MYAPQPVINGRAVAIGSHRDEIRRAIETARRVGAQPCVAIAIIRSAAGWRLGVTGEAPKRPAEVTIFRFDEIDRAAVRDGENAGGKLTEIHVVRAIASLGAWNGQPFDLLIGAGPASHVAVLVQQDDGTIPGPVSL